MRSYSAMPAPALRQSVRKILLISSLLLLPAVTHALENFHGNARLFGSQQETNQPALRSFDQQYNLSYRRYFLPYLQASFALNYHDLQSHQDPANDAWHGELMPSGNLTWNAPFFNFGVNYRYREIRDLIAANEALNRGAGLLLRTKFISLPQSQISYDWDRNATNSGFLISEIEQRRFQYQTNYYYQTAGLHYNYSRLLTDNLSANTALDQMNHVARLDFSQRFFQDKRLRFSGDYLFTYSRNRQSGGENAQPATQIPALVGLYAFDSTPEFGSLDTVTALIDGNLTAPTDPPINMGGIQAGQNVGFDLGSSQLQINLIYVYVDTTSDESVGWTVYTSSDNLAWSALPLGALSLYNLAFRRYEMSFSPTTTRYFKVVNSGVNEQPEVLITEIQAFLTSQAAPNLPAISRNHRVSLNASYQMLRQLQIGLDASYGALTENLSGRERQESSLAGSAAYRPSEFFIASVRLQHSSIDYSEAEIPLQESNIFSLTFLSNPLPALEVSLSGSRYETKEDNRLSQINSSGLLHASFLLIPGFSGIAEVGLARHEQLQADYSTDTYTYRLSADANPYQNLNLTVNYSVQDYFSDLSGATGRRDDVSGRFNYRATASLSLQGGLAYSREQEQENVDQDYALSWNLSERLSASASAHLQDAGAGNRTRQFGMQANLLLSNRTDVFGSYSFNEFGTAADNETVSYQVGFNTGF